MKIEICDLTKVDDGVPEYFDFVPKQSVGAHNIPSNLEEITPCDLFKSYFDSTVVDCICSASNEYAERNKSKYPTMYAYLRQMTPEKFYKFIGIHCTTAFRLSQNTTT